jgi:hypothetical protein
MAIRRESRKIERTPEQLAELKAARERFQRERPTPEDLAASGEWDRQPGWLTDAILTTVARVKAERQRRGLRLDDVSARSGIDKAYLSRLETGKVKNPTLATLGRYAESVGLHLAIDAVEATAG